MCDGRGEDLPAAMVDTGLCNNSVARWLVGLVQFLRRIRRLQSHATKYSLNSYHLRFQMVFWLFWYILGWCLKLFGTKCTDSLIPGLKGESLFLDL